MATLMGISRVARSDIGSVEMSTLSIVKSLIFSLVLLYPASIRGHEENGMNSGDVHTPTPSPGTLNASSFPVNSSNQSTASAPIFADRSTMLTTGNANCDNGITDICKDWCDDENGKINYTCCEKNCYPINKSITPIKWNQTIPSGYVASHICMRSPIKYPSWNTTYGPHRPTFCTYGEYKFLPRTRWLHNCEHGAIVLLYHPCADPTEVKKLKTLVKNCLRRHLITPFTLLPRDRPLALSAWGHALYMNWCDEASAVEFIKAHALKGPENVPVNGGYKYCLLQQSNVCDGSTFDDSKLCPQYHFP